MASNDGIEATEVLEQNSERNTVVCDCSGGSDRFLNADKGTSVRLLHKGAQSFSSFALGRTGRQVISRQIRRLKTLPGVPVFADLSKNLTATTGDVRGDATALDNEELTAWCDVILETIKDEVPGGLTVEVKGISLKQDRDFHNSAGAKIRERSELSHAMALISDNWGATYLANFRPGQPVSSQLPEQMKYVSYGRRSHLPSGQYPIVLGPKVTWVLFHEIVGHQVEADSIIAGSSSYTGLIGRKVASEEVTVVDDPFMMDFGGYQFDDEGTKGQGTLVIEEGILHSYLHSRETALLFDTESSGNFLSESFEYRPIVRQSNVFLEPKDWETDELIEHVRNGVYVEDCSLGVTYSLDGSFTLRARTGRLIEDGELGDTVLNFSLNGNPHTVLGSIFGIGKGIRPWSAQCLKGGQLRTVGAVGPSVGLDNVRVI